MNVNAIVTLTGLRDSHADVYIPKRFVGSDRGGMVDPSGVQVFTPLGLRLQGYEEPVFIENCDRFSITLWSTEKLDAYVEVTPGQRPGRKIA